MLMKKSPHLMCMLKTNYICRNLLHHTSSKNMLTRNDHTPKPESPVRQARTALDSNQGVPVTLISKLTRRQQTVRYESVSAGFPNNSHASYRQGSAETKKRQQIRYKKHVLKAIYTKSAKSYRYRYATRRLDLKPTRAR